jgi:hypothetical protein
VVTVGIISLEFRKSVHVACIELVQLCNQYRMRNMNFSTERKRCRVKRFVPISHSSFLHISVLPALQPPLTVLQDVPPSASSPVLESMPRLLLFLSIKISYSSLFARILESHRMTCSPRIIHSMEHPLKSRHRRLPMFPSRSREFVTPRRML